MYAALTDTALVNPLKISLILTIALFLSLARCNTSVPTTARPPDEHTFQSCCSVAKRNQRDHEYTWNIPGGMFAQPIITLSIPGTPLKTTHLQKHAPSVQNSGPSDPWQASDA
uniref:Uncharacterized protein n=1 Tax=Eutreptiella gymnastica TaxID=73025 RepID=A0A7S4LGL1_9EUGL